MAPSSLAPSSPLSDLSESLFHDQAVSPARSSSSNCRLRATSRTPSPPPPEKVSHHRETAPVALPPSPSAMVNEQVTSESKAESPEMEAGQSDQPLSPRLDASRPGPPPVTEAHPGTGESRPTTPPRSNTTSQPTRPTRASKPRSKTPSSSPPPAANTSKKRKAPIPATAKKLTLTNKKRKASNAKWSIPFVYTDSKSPLVTADLRAILLHPMAWDCLEDEERREIAGMLGLPLAQDGVEEGGGEAKERLPRPDLSYLLNRDEFRTDCRRYQEAIEAEQFDEGWLKEAWIAHERRRRGDFRLFLEGKLERDWGVRGPEEGEDGGEDGEEEGRDVSPKSVEMKSVSGEKRSRETSGSHSTVSTVGERRFTGLKLGLKDEQDGADGIEGQTIEDTVAAV